MTSADAEPLDLFAQESESRDREGHEEASGADGENSASAFSHTSAGNERAGLPSAPNEAESRRASRQAAPPDDEPRVWSVGEVNLAVKRLLEQTLPALWVGGEVANWTHARSGHRYFTLKDDRAQLRCVMWKRDAAGLPVDPEEGMRVRAFGSLTLYEARGEYQLAVRELEAEGEEGLWRLAFEKLRLQLQQEGLLDPARKRRIPRFPRTVGVVTSTTGAALHDVLTVIRRRAPWTRVVVRGTRVQGAGASARIAEAVRVLGTSGRVEVLIVGRGGGSIEDLWAFNEEPVARAVAECPVPVISAVGHEVDVTISDLVADLRAPTPSAAAEAVVQDGAALLEVLDGVRPRLARALRDQTRQCHQRLREGRLRARRGIQRLIEPRRSVLARRSATAESAVRRILHQRREHLGSV
ncbi:MAG: exodeoxyribonuclease VII large subunit, partial [Gemmatimonadota bacterium]